MANIKEKIDMELKPYEEICEKTTEHLKELIMSSEEEDPQEILSVAKTLGEIVDVKKDIVEMCYKKQILEAMEESEYGVDYDEDGRLYYRGQSRDSMGRYTSRRGGRRGYEPMMPMEGDMSVYPSEYDGMSSRMYYGSQSGTTRQGGSRMGSSRPSRYGFAMEHKGEEGKKAEMLNDFIDDLEDMAKDAMKSMTPEEKQIWKMKINKLTNM